MTAFRMPFRVLAASAFMVAAPLAAASAQIAEEAAARLQAYAADGGFKLEWEAIETSGDDAVLVGVRMGEGETMVPVGDVTLDGVSRDDKGYRIESVTLPSFRVSDEKEGFDLALDAIELGDVLLPDEDRRDYYGGDVFYRTIDVDALSMTVRGTEVLTMAGIHGEATEPDEDTPMDFTGAAERFSLDMSVMEDKDQLAVLDALGLSRLEGRFDVEGSWNPNDGRLVLSRYDTVVDGAGTFGLTFEAGGATPDLIGSMRDLLKTAEENPDADDSAQELAAFGLLQQLTFHNAALRFDDDSLTNRVLDYVAKNQGMKRADIANQSKAVLPFLLAQLNNPDLTAQATQAVSTFLDDPKSLTISARPAQPVPFAMLAATAMMVPAELTKALGVTVSAND